MKANQFLLTIICLLIIYSCKRESPCSSYTSKNFKFLLADSTKAQIPYNGNEILMFISNQGDTAILTGQGKNNYIVKNSINVGTSPDCPKYDDYSYEYVDLDYKGNNENLFHVFYRLHIDNYNEIRITTNLNEVSGYDAGIGIYNDSTRYNKSIKGIKGYNFDRNDGKPAFVYNKSIGILQIKIDSNLIYTLKQ